MSTHGERLKKIIDAAFEGNQRKFARAMNLDPTVVSRGLAGGYPVPRRCDVLLADNGINPAFLRDGRGDIFLNEEDQKKYQLNKPESTEFISKDEQIKTLQDFVDTLKKANEQQAEQITKLMSMLAAGK